MRAKFFYKLNGLSILGRMARPRGDVREAEFSEKRSDVALAIIDAEPFGDDALEVNTPPTDDPIDFSVGAYFDDPGEFAFWAADRRATGPLAQLSRSPSGPAALNR